MRLDHKKTARTLLAHYRRNLAETPEHRVAGTATALERASQISLELIELGLDDEQIGLAMLAVGMRRLLRAQQASRAEQTVQSMILDLIDDQRITPCLPDRAAGAIWSKG